MKKVFITILIIIIIAVIGIISINVKKQNTDPTSKTTKVGFIMNGNADDCSWGQAHYDGIMAAAKKLNLDVDYRESISEGEECIGTIEDLINEGCEIIIANSYGFGSYMEAASKQHPDIYFLHCAGTYYNDNYSSYFGRIYQIRYLTGIVAGLKTESNSIGYVAAFDCSEVNRGINAFTLGVKSVNPDANVYVKYVNSWIDDAMTELAYDNLSNNHPEIDVYTVHTDSIVVYDKADKDGKYIIGYNYNNQDKYPNTYLTAAVWDWNVIYTNIIKSILQQKFIGQNYWDGIETGIVKISPLTSNVPEEATYKVEESQNKLKTGSWDVFLGPVYDNQGEERVSKGEMITDEDLLNNINWYVDGVIIDE